MFIASNERKRFGLCRSCWSLLITPRGPRCASANAGTSGFGPPVASGRRWRRRENRSGRGGNSADSLGEFLLYGIDRGGHSDPLLPRSFVALILPTGYGQGVTAAPR